MPLFRVRADGRTDAEGLTRQESKGFSWRRIDSTNGELRLE